MKQIEKDLRVAIARREAFRQSNTEYDPTSGKVFLFGNVIACETREGWRYSLAGWPTATTRSRLKALGLPLWTKAGRTYLGTGPDARELDDHEWFTSTNCPEPVL